MEPGTEPDAGLSLDTLRASAARLQTLEGRLAELESERERLAGSNRHLELALAELHGAMGEWEWFFEHSLEMMCIAGIDGRFSRVNPAFAKALGYSREELVSRPFLDFVHPDDRESTLNVYAGLGHDTDCINFENRYLDSEGEWHWISWRVPALAPGARSLYAIARDITAQKRAESELLHRAMHDPLTGLLNRAAFEDGLGDAILRASRNPRQELALFLVDLDGFKHVNDTHGHPAGDRVLREVAVRLRRIAREGEMVSRIGGDEFAFLIEGDAQLRVEPLARRIDEALRRADGPLGRLPVGCCVGVAILPRHAADAESLFARADQALYHVKRAGKGGYRVFEPA